MPPKKKGGKKAKKGKKSADEASNSGRISSGKEGKELNELSKEFYLIQIKDLEQRLSRYQKKCDELSLSNAEFEEKHKQLTQDRKEIVDFLKKSLEQRQDEISDLNDRLSRLQQAKETEKEGYENQLSQLKREFQDTRDQLTSENMILGGKLASLEEFKVQKEDLMKKFAEMEDKLKQQETEHAEKIYNLERKAVVDKDRLKKEMVLRVNTVAAEFRKVSNKQMADTTKRNIRENVSINSQLAKMSEKTKELIQENDDLREKERKQRLQIELLESSQEDLAKKNNSNLKVLKMITQRARQQEIQLSELEAREQAYVEMEENAAQTREINDQLTLKLKRTDDELQEMKELLKRSESDREKEMAGRERLEDVLTAAAFTLKQVASESPDEDELEVKTKRQTMIERLLLVLDSAALLGKAPPPADFFQQRPKTLMAPLSMVREASRNETSQLPSKEFPHYNLGDLGLVPRPRKLVTKQAAIASKVSHLSPTTRIGVKSSVAVGKLTSHALHRHDKLPVIEQKSV